MRMYIVGRDGLLEWAASDNETYHYLLLLVRTTKSWLNTNFCGA